MLVKYNSLNRVDKPLMTLCNPGSQHLGISKPDNRVIGPIVDTEAEEIIYNFNAPSELNFRMNRVIRGDKSIDGRNNTVFNGLLARRLIYVDGIGYFSITSVKTGYSEGAYYKDVSAQSAEIEIQQQSIPYIEDGTYYLFTQNNHKGILDIVMEVLQSSFGINKAYYDILTEEDTIQKEIERCQTLIRLYEEFMAFIDDPGDILPGTLAYEKAIKDFNDAIEQNGGETIEQDTTENMEAAINSQLSLAVDALEQAKYDMGLAKEQEREIREQIASDGAYATSAYPAWTIRYIAPSLAGKMRTFEDVDPTLDCLTFLTENLQEAYECIFIFDPSLRMIDVYDQNEFSRETNIQLSVYDFIDTMEITENSDEVFSALNVRASDDTGIGSVNPLGTNIIYNFDYYKPWMSSALRTAIANWEAGLADENPSHHGIGHYLSVNKKYYHVLTEQSNTQSEIERLELLKQLYQRLRDNIVAESGASQLNKYNQAIVANGGASIPAGAIDRMLGAVDSQISSVNSGLATQRATLRTLVTQAASYSSEIAYDNLWNGFTSQSHYFNTPELVDELRNFIFEGSYTDEFLTITEDMTYDEQFEQMEALYRRGVEQLNRVSQPNPEFTVDSESGLFVREFARWSDELETGCIIDVLYRRTDTQDEVASLFLSSITVNYDEQTMSLKFAGKLNRSDPKALYKKVLGQISKSANSVNFINNAIAPVKEGQFDEMKAEIQGSRDITVQAAFASANEEIVIDGSGLTGKAYDASTGTYDPRQIKITSQNIIFTDDGWSSAKTAIGRMLWRDTEVYGINGQAIIGDIIIGENVFLKNEDNTVTFDNTGLTIQNTRNAIRIFPGDNGDNLMEVTDNTDPLSPKMLLGLTSSGSLYLNPEAVQIAWNNNGETIRIEDVGGMAQLNIYQSYVNPYNYQKLISFDQTGSNFYNPDNNAHIGKIGTSYYSGSAEQYKGLAFDLDYDGYFMAWTSQDTENGTYEPVLSYMSKDLDPTLYTFKKGLHLDADIWIHPSNVMQIYSDIRILDGSQSIDIYHDIDMHGYTIQHAIVTAPSDIRLKKNIEEYTDSALTLIDSIKLNSFDWVETDKHEDIGFIAQQLREVIPDAVQEDDKSGRLYVKPMHLIPYLVGAVQDLYKLIKKE